MALRGRSLVAAGLMLAMSGCTTMLDVPIEEVAATAQPTVIAAALTPKRPTGSILVRIFKEESELEVWRLGGDGRYAKLKTYPLCRWSGKLGPKMTEGDRQAPEGFYAVSARLMNPNSKYEKSFNLGYPNRLEKALGYTGDSLMVHGACSSSGCYAMTDEGVAELYAIADRALRSGQSDFQVQAFPFRMTASQMAKHHRDPNIGFWRNLKMGYDIFEVTRREPTVSTCGGRYVFNATRTDGSRAAMDPIAACPTLTTAVDPAVTAKQQKDDAETQALVSWNRAETPMSYVDGGMHSSFRDMLKRLGPEELAKVTSSTLVPVSRPSAALQDPYSSRGESVFSRMLKGE
ncbi:L,D-transpeptidase family protein [Antarcticirhabdus aurantiaca]|uniref:Murein L,D-transpeptidase n=1 Tax=Antarcticirhabdus aurantiaca TaxID=2606717 RepID=A0ACD4NVI2_9HYPH|nr:murein L,D-transpeptidase family protein [Antarcticirhabdus aurantiaca]WAJ30976.1 murein L,D-transpeptidase [Jeongeuplla avenae]